ncbi:MAG: methylglyoxal synthase [Devosia sp.]
MDDAKRIALVAHDAAKATMAAWAFANERVLKDHQVYATGNTGRLLLSETGLDVTCLRSGPLGGDLELGAMIAEGRIDILFMFVDPLTPKPHDVDPHPLLRIATLAQTAVATNEATADFIIRSDLLSRPYHRVHGLKALTASTQRIDSRRRSN